MNAEEFERRFNSRTLSYTSRPTDDERPVVVEITETAHNPAGHLMATSLANLLVRAHRRLVFRGELDRGLLCRSPFGHRSLAQATVGLAEDIRPTADVWTSDEELDEDPLIELSIGGPGEMALGATGWVAELGGEGAIGADEGSLFGAMLAACLGARAAFARLLGEDSGALRVSLWDPRGGGDGPSVTPPLSLGNVLQVGAGGVGGALDLWLASLGSDGEIVIVDGDLVEIENLNRQLIFIAADAGIRDGKLCNKAGAAAARLGSGATPSRAWYGEVDAIVERNYDIVLPLANEYGAREALQDRRPPALLHATTGANHQAQLHRHLPGLDDCIRCRLPGQAARTACSTATLPGPEAGDAALPYLSGLAGLLLLTSMVKQSLGLLADEPHNLLSVELLGLTPRVSAFNCGCNRECPQASD